MFAEGKARGIETRGVSDHGFIHSIYFRDPNGYVIELTAKMPGPRQGDGPGDERRARQARALAGGEGRAAPAGGLILINMPGATPPRLHIAQQWR